MLMQIYYFHNVTKAEFGTLPYKFFADRAEGGLVEEGGCELVVPDDMNLWLFESSSPPVQGSDSILWHHFHRLLTWGCGKEQLNHKALYLKMGLCSLLLNRK